MKITPKIQFVSGSFDTKEAKLVLIPSDKHGLVELCVKEPDSGWNIPIGEIKLYSSDLYVDFKATLEDATMAHDLGFTLEAVAQMNIDNLASRQRRGKLGGSGAHR